MARERQYRSIMPQGRRSAPVAGPTSATCSRPPGTVQQRVVPERRQGDNDRKQSNGGAMSFRGKVWTAIIAVYAVVIIAIWLGWK